MTKFSLHLKSISDTQKLAYYLARHILKKPALIFLQGNMGAGKTTLATFIIKDLIKTNENILSPTYSYMNSYQADMPIYHFDLYRIENHHQIIELGLMEYIEDDMSIRIIEWPQKLADLNISPDVRIQMETKGDERRVLINYDTKFQKYFYSAPTYFIGLLSSDT